MNFDIHGYNTREAGLMNVYPPNVHTEIYTTIYIFLNWLANFGMIFQILRNLYEYALLN